MTKRIFYAFSLSLVCLIVSAQDNFEVAKEFMSKKGIDLKSCNSKTRSGITTEYDVFTGIDDIGFAVVVNGKIIGYSTDSKINVSNLPIGFMDLLNVHTKAETRGGESTYPEGFVPKNWEPVEPLITAEWGQVAPYNNDCPMIDEHRLDVGCTVVATGMLMYYYNYPTEFRAFEGIIIDEEQNNNVITKLEPLPEFKIQWDKMLDTYECPHTEEEEKAVSEFLMNLGYRMPVAYTTHGTGGDACTFLAKNYDCYSTCGEGYDWVKSLSDEETDSVLYISLLDGRPICVQGGGHAYLIDGCDSDGLFHCNWGGTGNGNGYFYFSKEIWNNYYKNTNYRNLWGEGGDFTIPYFPKDNIRKKLGDVNGDGIIDYFDVEEIVNYLLGNPSPKFNIKYSDVNKDAVVNIADIVTIIDNNKWVMITDDFDKSIPITKIRVLNKVSDSSVSALGCASFSTSPNEEIDVDKFFVCFSNRTIGDNTSIYNSKPIDSFKHVGGNWYEYEFSRPVFFAYFDDNCPREQIKVLINDKPIK